MDKSAKPQALNAEDLENVAGGASGNKQAGPNTIWGTIVPATDSSKPGKVIKGTVTKKPSHSRSL